MRSGEEPAHVTRWWFADSSVSYVLAVTELFEFARHHRGQLAFGPMDGEAMKDGGLEVTGPPGLLDDIAKLLARVPGLGEAAAGSPIIPA